MKDGDMTMDSKSLMINDWVLVHNKPQRVAIIEETCISYWAELYMSCELLSPSLADIHPIPITAEILEKNGFEVKKESKMLGLTIAACYELNNEAEYPNKYWIRIDDFSDDEKIRMSFDIQYPKKIHKLSGLDIAYVHELQHALRLCGLNNLSDNFKI